MTKTIAVLSSQPASTGTGGNSLRSRVVSLSHVKKDDDPIHVPEKFAAPKKVMAWPGGKITTNKSSAMREFAARLREKRKRGEKLTAAQENVLAKFPRDEDEDENEAQEKSFKRRKKSRNKVKKGRGAHFKRGGGKRSTPLGKKKRGKQLPARSLESRLSGGLSSSR